MEGTDKNTINRLIEDLSKGSDYHKKEMERTLKAKEKAIEHQHKI